MLRIFATPSTSLIVDSSVPLSRLSLLYLMVFACLCLCVSLHGPCPHTRPLSPMHGPSPMHDHAPDPNPTELRTDSSFVRASD